MSTIALAERGYAASERTGHVAIRFFFVSDNIRAGELEVKCMPTEDTIAGILTKPLQGKPFRRLRRWLTNWPDADLEPTWV